MSERDHGGNNEAFFVPEEFVLNFLILKIFYQREKLDWSRIGQKCSKRNKSY
jgi:hypothetical protein